MDNTKDTFFVNRPPIFYGTNYDYWKAKMVSFLKSMDNKTWKIVVKCWKHPMNISQDGASNLKPKVGWTDVEDNEDLGNSKALDVIFIGLDKNIFRFINTSTKVKDAREILKTAHKGTSKVRMSRLQLLTTEFEDLRMNENESISNFNITMIDISNTSFALGEKMYEEKMARKIIRCLPKKFDMNATAIEESQDLSNIKVEKLVGYLQTFEMDLNDRSKKKKKSIGFVTNTEEDEHQREESFLEAISLFGRTFNKALTKLDKNWRTNVLDKVSTSVP